jgi:shikimate kinase
MNTPKFKRIFVIGQPGAGKGLVAKSLAEKIGWRFIDADLGLEWRIGRYLSEIVGKPQGVETFLQCQTEILEAQLKMDSIVVATDASLLASQKNKDIISSEFVIYLKVSIPIQLERLSRDSVKLLPMDDYTDFLEGMHRERDGVYEKAASITIDSDDSALNEHIATIMKAISVDENTADTKINLERKDFILFHKTKYIPVQLTDQQARCLKLLAQGKSSKEIANKLHISHRTVEEYIAKTIELLGCASSKELIALYHDQP